MIGYVDYVEYTLRNKDLGPKIISEPIGWKDDEKEYSRHDRYHGIIAKFSNSLKFNGDAKDYINLVYSIYGINAEIELIKKEKHPQTDMWELSYSGYLDLSTWSQEGEQVSVKFSSGGLEQALKARESDQIEIDRLESLAGVSLPPLETVNVEMDGRRIFLKTTYDVKSSENEVNLHNETNGNTRGSTYAIPLVLVNKSHDAAQSPIAGTVIQDNNASRPASGTNGLCFFAVSDRIRTLQLNFSLKFKAKITRYDRVNFFRFWVRLVIYQNGSNYIKKDERILFTTDQTGALQNNSYAVNFAENITINEGDSLALVLDQIYDGENGHTSNLDIKVYDIECTGLVYENSFFEPTKTNTILAYELGQRICSIISNRKDAFYSDFLGRIDNGYNVDGPGALVGFSHGFWIRGFAANDETFKPLTTSLKDYLESINAVLGAGVGIEKINNKDTLRIEDEKYFYNLNTTIKLPNQIEKEKRYIATEHYFSSIEVGYELGGDYEEACGLDEPNARANYFTVIDRIKNVFTKIAKYRADSYGIEFARRLQKYLNDTRDSSYDSNIFMLDLKRHVAFLYKQRKWQDDFANEPTGIFSPETATNLRFSPLNNLFRHGWRIASGLTKYATDYIVYGSSTANSRLKTGAYAENDNVINSELQRARFVNEWIEFEHEVDFEIMKMVEGKTVILGKEIMNWYGLVEFENSRGLIERGFLFNLKPKQGSGQWKVLKANR